MKILGKFGFEFLSIFVAVIAAFALNNWNENRKSFLAENKILTEIHHGLNKDLSDIELNILGHKAGIEAAGYFRDLIANKPLSDQDFLRHYFCLTRDFISVQNTSGYETLKSRGLELIQNDALRTKIIAIYEYDYNTLKKLEEDYSELQFNENYFDEINRYFSPNLEFNENNQLTGITTPIKLSENDKKLILSYLWKIEVNRNFILSYNLDVKKKIEELRTEIKKEIEK